MNLQTGFLKFVSQFYKRERDPRRAQAIWQEYDQRRGYADYLLRCRAAFRRSPPPLIDVDLEQRGYAFLRALEPAAATVCAMDLQSRYQPQLLKKDSRDLLGFRVDDRQWLRDLLGGVLQGAVDSSVAAFFRSEYLVHWVAFSLTRQAEEQASVSFRWHCDKGPSAHLKLIIYLNSTVLHGGNTEFMDLAHTETVARRGYLFGWSRTRTGEVSHLSRLAGCKLETELRERDAGEAVLFQPARVLHRGVSPARGQRLTATLCLLPSPVHWKQAFECETMSNLAVDEKWHDDALAFLDGLKERLQGEGLRAGVKG
jgi:hypothetical protein